MHICAQKQFYQNIHRLIYEHLVFCLCPSLQKSHIISQCWNMKHLIKKDVSSAIQSRYNVYDLHLPYEHGGGWNCACERGLISKELLKVLNIKTPCLLFSPAFQKLKMLHLDFFLYLHYQMLCILPLPDPLRI